MAPPPQLLQQQRQLRCCRRLRRRYRTVGSSRFFPPADNASLSVAASFATTTRRRGRRRILPLVPGMALTMIMVVIVVVVVVDGFTTAPSSRFSSRRTTTTTLPSTGRRRNSLSPARRDDSEYCHPAPSLPFLSKSLLAAATTTIQTATLSGDDDDGGSSARRTSSSSLRRRRQRTPQQQPRPHGGRLTASEEKELLAAAVELRRIRRIESELVLSPSSFSSTGQEGARLRQRRQITSAAIAEQQHNSNSDRNHDDDEALVAKAAGYGDDVESLISAMERGRRAREQLITRNMGLVHYFVTDVMKKNGGVGSSNSNSNEDKLACIHRDDLLQEGAIGLSKAVDRWDPDIGGKFSSYAAYWIRAAVYRGIADRDDAAFRVPEHVSTDLRKVVRAAADLGIELNGGGDDGDVLGVAGTGVDDSANYRAVLAEAAGLTEKQVERALRVRRHRRRGGVLSFESWMQRGRDYETDSAASAAVAAGSRATSCEWESDDAQREHIHDTLSRFLRPRELEALSWRYGLLREDEVPKGRGDDGDDSGGSRSSTDSLAAAAAAASATQPIPRKTGGDRSRNHKRDYLAEAEQRLFGNTAEGAFHYKSKESATAAAAAAGGNPASSRKTAGRTVSGGVGVGGGGGGRWGEAMSFAEVGQRMQISAEYGRRLCKAALEKLRRAAAEGRLEPAAVTA